MSFVLDPEHTASRSFCCAAAEELRLALEIARDGDRSVEERIHDARAHCKRLRALLRIAGSKFPSYRRENGAIREAAAALSCVRDSQVLRQTLAAFTERRDSFTQTEADQLNQAVATDADDAATGAETLERFADQLETIAARVNHWPIDHVDWEAIATGAGRTYARAAKAMRLVERSGLAADLHEWRKQVKYHWHQMTLLRRFDPARFKPLRDELKRLAQLLGEHHDLEVLRFHLKAAAETDRRLMRRLIAEIERRQSSVAAEAQVMGSMLFAQRPTTWHTQLATVLESYVLPKAEPQNAAGD